MKNQEFLPTLWAIVLIVGAFYVSGGCATYAPPKQYDVEKERVYSLSYDEVWNKVVEWFALHGTPVKNMDKQSGFIASELSLNTANFPEYSDCGKGEGGLFVSVDVTDPVGNFNLLVRRVDEKTTRVHVTVSFGATIDQAFHGQYGTTHKYTKITCTSKGVLEKQLLDYITQK